MPKQTPFVLVILDGWGVAPPSKGNAISLAATPNMDRYTREYPNTLLDATGTAVGLEPNEMSGSEAGHLNLGAGRIVIQDSRYISEAMNDGSFFRNPAFVGAVRHIKRYQDKGAKLHLMGLLSTKDSPHSDPDHIIGLLIMAKKKGVKNVFLHLFTDGRDAHPRSSLHLLKGIKKVMDKVDTAEIASIGGRYYAMDRIKRWDRLKKAYDLMVHGKGKKALSAEEAIKSGYKEGLNDEFLEPTLIVRRDKEPVALIEDNDAVIFFNLRSDRARQFTKPFVLDEFAEFDRGEKLKNLYFVAMTDFGPDLGVETAFPSRDVEMTLPMVLKKKKQLYIAETEKFAHITYFFNGGYADPVGGEARVMIESPDVDHYDKKPEMSAREITSVVVGNLKYDVYNFIAVNFANPDMVGHTGNIKAARKAVETVDECLGKVIETVLEKEGEAIITADHGNADEMLDLRTGEIITSHSKNPVPCVIVSERLKSLGEEVQLKRGILGDVAPTILDLLGVEKPKEMTGSTIIQKERAIA